MLPAADDPGDAASPGVVRHGRRLERAADPPRGVVAAPRGRRGRAARPRASPAERARADPVARGRAPRLNPVRSGQAPGYTFDVPTERLMLLDGYGLVYRGYFALPPLTTSQGDLVNGAFGFASIVLRGLQDLQPDYLAVSFDLPGPDVPPRAVRRVQGDPDEDAGRPPRPVPEGPRDRQGAPDPGLRDAGLRGRRRHRDDHPAARSLATTSRRRSSPSTSTCSSSSRRGSG